MESAAPILSLNTKGKTVTRRKNNTNINAVKLTNLTSLYNNKYLAAIGPSSMLGKLNFPVTPGDSDPTPKVIDYGHPLHYYYVANGKKSKIYCLVASIFMISTCCLVNCYKWWRTYSESDHLIRHTR